MCNRPRISSSINQHIRHSPRSVHSTTASLRSIDNRPACRNWCDLLAVSLGEKSTSNLRIASYSGYSLHSAYEFAAMDGLVPCGDVRVCARHRQRSCQIRRLWRLCKRAGGCIETDSVCCCYFSLVLLLYALQERFHHVAIPSCRVLPGACAASARRQWRLVLTVEMVNHKTHAGNTSVDTMLTSQWSQEAFDFFTNIATERIIESTVVAYCRDDGKPMVELTTIIDNEVRECVE